MNSFRKRRWLLTLALSGLVFTAISCNDMEGDQRKADMKVRTAVASSAKNRLTPTTKSWDSAVADLNSAVAEKNASLTSKIRASSLLAEAEYEAGDRIVRDLNRLDPVIADNVWEVGQIASQIQTINDGIKALAAGDPAATLTAIQTKRTEMSAASAAAAQKAGQLQGDIDKVKGQVNALIQQKDAAIAEADSAAEKASKASLKDADALLDSVTESRRKAGNLGHDIDKLSATLLPLERDFATEEGKKKAADGAVAALDESKKSTDAAWALVQGQMQAQKTLAGTLGEQLAAKAKALDDLNKQAATLRAKALEQFANSAKHNGSASSDAKALATQLDSWSRSDKFSGSAESKAWTQLRNLYNLNVFKLLEAEANNAQGNLYTAQAAQLGAQQKLLANIARTLADAGVTMPASLSAAVDAEQKKAQEAANKVFSEAAEKFSGVSAVTTYPKEVKEAAQISRMFSLYGQYLNGDSTKLGEAKKMVDEFAKEHKDDPILRSLPADLRG